MSKNLTILNDIKTGPYWRVSLRPLEKYSENKLKTISEIKDIVERTKVSLRGWDFPHISYDISELYSFDKGLEMAMKSEKYIEIKEFWRFYKSGQFVHFFPVHEDSNIKKGIIKNAPLWTEIKNKSIKGYLGTLTTLYRLTEIYEFAKRLTNQGLYEKGISINISLNNIGNFILTTMDFRRPLFNYYICNSEQIELPEKNIAQNKIIKNCYDYAIKDTIDIFEQFNWLDANIDILKEDQRKLLERRI